MPARRDYASRKRNGKTATRSSSKKPAAPRKAPAKKPLPWKLVIVTLLLTGALVYLLYTLLQVKPGSPQTKTLPAPVKVQPAPKPAAATPAPASKPAPAKAESAAQSDDQRFEFYKMLPKSEVTTSDPSVYKSTPKDAKSEDRYMLQAGSFRNAADADRMRAQLILLGLPQVNSQKTVSDKGDVWYRVRTGPFDNRTELKNAYEKLAKQNIFPLKIKVD